MEGKGAGVTLREHGRDIGAPSPVKAMGPEAPLPPWEAVSMGHPQAQPPSRDMDQETVELEAGQGQKAGE